MSRTKPPDETTPPEAEPTPPIDPRTIPYPQRVHQLLAVAQQLGLTPECVVRGQGRVTGEVVFGDLFA
jgi:hypothetical protein